MARSCALRRPRIRGYLVVLSLAAAATLSACGGGGGAVKPGGKVGKMTLTNDALSSEDTKFFDFCNPFISKAGVYRRSCDLPAASRLWIGYGSFATTRKLLEAEWKATKWELWLDGRRIDLEAFGTADRTLYGLPQAGGSNATLREWKVTVIRPTAGRHTLRYRSRPVEAASDAVNGGVTDATFTFTVGRS